jgi:hypothetical protein
MRDALVQTPADGLDSADGDPGSLKVQAVGLLNAVKYLKGELAVLPEDSRVCSQGVLPFHGRSSDRHKRSSSDRGTVVWGVRSRTELTVYAALRGA